MYMYVMCILACERNGGRRGGKSGQDQRLGWTIFRMPFTWRGVLSLGTRNKRANSTSLPRSNSCTVILTPVSLSFLTPVFLSCKRSREAQGSWLRHGETLSVLESRNPQHQIYLVCARAHRNIPCALCLIRLKSVSFLCFPSCGVSPILAFDLIYFCFFPGGSGSGFPEDDEPCQDPGKTDPPTQNNRAPST
jgi:hypothetical protein